MLINLYASDFRVEEFENMKSEKVTCQDIYAYEKNSYSLSERVFLCPSRRIQQIENWYHSMSMHLCNIPC